MDGGRHGSRAMTTISVGHCRKRSGVKKYLMQWRLVKRSVKRKYYGSTIRVGSLKLKDSQRKLCRPFSVLMSLC